MFTDVGPLELVTLAVLAVLLFGPDRLPEFIENVTGFLRKVRAFSEDARQEVRTALGPEFQDFEFEDLHPKTFVRKHLLDGDDLDLDGIRSALDPRAELTELAEAVRDPAHDAPAARRVSLTKTPPAHTAFDPDAT
ncbi:sec-independent translocase [Streptomyces shenzhenensis]|uniref:Preprotein translocase n=1 Tax=Streptomyces shenzhenensis TaxID=943815 RepID=A0A3M0IBN4_9ACTN|nr:sec-independent translocase [Streptomyces shenzhenensis]RMB85460.1 preprotein translocase [Streptomyces shenzhenensis]